MNESIRSVGQIRRAFNGAVRDYQECSDRDEWPSAEKLIDKWLDALLIAQDAVIRLVDRDDVLDLLRQVRGRDATPSEEQQIAWMLRKFGRDDTLDAIGIAADRKQWVAPDGFLKYVVGVLKHREAGYGW